MPRSCDKISDTVVFGIPRWASSSHTVSLQSLLIAACTCSTFSGVLLIAGLAECGSLCSFSTIFEVFMLSFYLCCTHCIVPESLLNHPVVSAEECSSLMRNLLQIHCSTFSVILNAMATQYTCSLTSVYWPYRLVQWSSHCSHMRIPATLLSCQVTLMSCKLFSLY